MGKRYQTLKDKADLCRRNAIRCDAGSWGYTFWMSVAYKLETTAANLPLCGLVD